MIGFKLRFLTWRKIMETKNHRKNLFCW